MSRNFGKMRRLWNFSQTRFSLGKWLVMGAFKMRFTRASLLVPAMALVACGAAMAQSPTYKVGRPPTEAELRAWDNVVGPDGKELPPGAGTAKDGAKVYAGKCSFCHGPTGIEGPAPRLVGGVDSVSTRGAGPSIP